MSLEMILEFLCAKIREIQHNGGVSMSPAQIIALILQDLPGIIAFIEQVLGKSPAPANAAQLQSFINVAKQLHAPIPVVHAAAPIAPHVAAK